MNCSSFEPETCQQNSPMARGRFHRLSRFATHLFLGLVRVKVAGNSSRVWRPRGFAGAPSVRSDERTHDWSSSKDSAVFVFIVNIISLDLRPIEWLRALKGLTLPPPPAERKLFASLHAPLAPAS